MNTEQMKPHQPRSRLIDTPGCRAGVGSDSAGSAPVIDHMGGAAWLSMNGFTGTRFPAGGGSGRMSEHQKHRLMLHPELFLGFDRESGCFCPGSWSLFTKEDLLQSRRRWLLSRE